MSDAGTVLRNLWMAHEELRFGLSIEHELADMTTFSPNGGPVTANYRQTGNHTITVSPRGMRPIVFQVYQNDYSEVEQWLDGFIAEYQRQRR